MLLWLDVPGATGGVERWGIEMPAPNVLSRRAVHRAVFRPGDAIEARVFPSRDGRRFAWGHTLVLKNGKTIAMRTPGPAVAGPPDTLR